MQRGGHRALLIDADHELDEAKRIEDRSSRRSGHGRRSHHAAAVAVPERRRLPHRQASANAYAELANYRAINDWYQWTDVDGDGQIIIGAEQFPADDCRNPITECANSSWYVWMIAVPGAARRCTTPPTTRGYVVTEMMTGEPNVEVL